MTAAQKKIVTLLLSGHFLVKSRKCYTLYDEKVNPVQRIRHRSIQRLDQFIDPKMKLWKKDKAGRMTLNLNTIRQLHGKTTLKQLYKRKMSIDTTQPIYKLRTKKVKQTHNEKANYLF